MKVWVVLQACQLQQKGGLGSAWPWTNPQHLHESVKMKICCSKNILCPSDASYLLAGGCSKVGKRSLALCSTRHGVDVPIDRFGLSQW